MKSFLKNSIKIIIPLLLGAIVFGLVYKNMDFTELWNIIRNDVKIEWILFSLFFGTISNVIRAHRWQLLLKPTGYSPRLSNSIYAVFSLYFMNALVPRLGEFSRCAVLNKYEHIPFATVLGTVVSERIFDMICVLFIFAFGFSIDWATFQQFFYEQFHISQLANKLPLDVIFKIGSATLIALLMLVLFVQKRGMLKTKMQNAWQNLWDGITSIGSIEKKKIFFVETAIIWICYFLQFFVCIYAFGFTTHFSIIQGLTLYIMGSLGVLIPVPQGIGTWHFMIINTLILFGVSHPEAGAFALVVHTIQTLLLIVLGFFALIMLPITNK